jgi:SAM-dependent methyltransferase
LTKEFKYEGSELDLFANATNWKKYFSYILAPYLKGDVLEVVAGLGTTTQLLRGDPEKNTWTCLEPDNELASQLATALPDVELLKGTVENISYERDFDVIVYIDVLEHIADDVMEIEIAAQHLRPNGLLIILSPAHQWLFSEFDQSIGHIKRYSKKTLRQAVSKTFKSQKVFYINTVGLLASLANKLLLKQSLPTYIQIAFWDRYLIPLSRILDPLLGFCFGKSIVGIWKKL